MISKWDAQEALRLIEAERVTLFSSVPSLVKDLLTQPNIGDFDISSLHRVSSGGAAMPSDLPGIIEARIDKAYASGGYGLTETLAVGSQAAGAVLMRNRQPLACSHPSCTFVVRLLMARSCRLASPERSRCGAWPVRWATGTSLMQTRLYLLLTAG